MDSDERSLKIFRDNKATLDYAKQTAFEEGEIKGEIKAKIEVAKSLKQNGVSIDLISRSTGLSESEIEKL
jgi:predicted transposase/invertase (TIGR01784 family)